MAKPFLYGEETVTFQKKVPKSHLPNIEAMVEDYLKPFQVGSKKEPAKELPAVQPTKPKAVRKSITSNDPIDSVITSTFVSIIKLPMITFPVQVYGNKGILGQVRRSDDNYYTKREVNGKDEILQHISKESAIAYADQNFK